MINEQKILEIVSNCTAIPIGDILGESRYKKFVEARVLSMFFVRRYCPQLSLKAIGSIFNRDHSSVIHALNNCKVWKEFDEEFKDKYERVQSFIPKEYEPQIDGNRLVASIKLELIKENGKRTFSFNTNGSQEDLKMLVQNACYLDETIRTALTTGLELFNHIKFQ